MPRVEIPFVGSTRPHRSPVAANQICRNWFPEIIRDDQGKQASRILVGAPGKTLLVDLSNRPIRALHMSSTKYEKYWAVLGDTLYEFLNNNQYTPKGKLRTNNGFCRIVDNGTHLLIVDGTGTGYVLDIATGVFTDDLNAVDSDFVGGDDVIYLGGYFIVIQPRTNVLQSCTSPYGTAPTTWDPLDVYSTALADAGPLIGLGAVSGLLFAFGDFYTQPFQNSGNPTGFPFSPISGAPIEFGTSSKLSIKELDGSLLWAAKTKKGDRIIVKTSGLSPQRISTHEIEYSIGRYTNINDCFADSYIDEGHSFYQLTFPTGNQTFVWDAATGEWHERASYGVGRDRAKGHIFFNGKHIVGDSTTGKLYTLSLDAFTEAGSPLVALRRCQHIKQAKNPLEIPGIIIDAETGVGLSGDVQGLDPQMGLRYSIDGGLTWSEWMHASMGKIGDYLATIRYPRLGTGEDWVFEIMVSDPVRRNILGAYVDG